MTNKMQVLLRTFKLASDLVEKLPTAKKYFQRKIYEEILLSHEYTFQFF